jgi:adenylate kinase
VLDGHFSLMEPNGVLVVIPMAVYLAIAPIAVVLVESESGVVYSRLLQRDGAAPPLESIPLFSERERAHAQAVSIALNVPMFVVRGDLPADETFDTAVSNLLPLVRGAT